MSTGERKNNDLGENLREGVRALTGILGAFKDAVEESFEDLRARGDLSPEAAREAARSTMKRAQEGMGDMRDRLDFVTRKEYEELRAEVDMLKQRMGMVGEQGPANTQATDAASTPPSSGGPGFPVDGA